MIKRMISVLLCLALLCGSLAGCGQDQRPREETGSTVRETGSAERESTQTQHTAAEDPIPTTDQPRIDWNTAFQMTDLPEGEVDADSIALLEPNEDGSGTVLTVPKAELGQNLPQRLPRTRYYERFMDPAVAEELLPILDLVLYRNCCAVCVPTARLSPGLVAESEAFLGPTYFDTYVFSARGVRTYAGLDGQTVTFLLVSVDNFREIRDRYRRLDGLNAANAFVDNFPEGLDEQGKMFRIYRWLTETVQFYHGGARQDYYDRPTWSYLFDAMIGHVAVDEGYAETLTVICNLAGIECFTVKSADSAWNVARIDGEYYIFDATRDRSLTPADFRYFGVSDETFRAYRGGDGDAALPFWQEYSPACGKDLFPVRPEFGDDGEDPASAISAYYEYRNARNGNPLFLFYRMGYEREAIGTEAPKDGWSRTRVDLDELTALLRGVMTAEEAARFASGHFEAGTEVDPKLSYRVPAEDPQLVRLAGLEDNGDGTWTAQLLRFTPPAGFSPFRETVTVTRIDGAWLVDGAE